MSKRQRVAGNVVLCDDNQSITTEVDEVQSRIRQRAFEISRNRNHTARDVDDWLAAESEVIVTPPIEVAEKEGEFILRVAAPGIHSRDLTIMATRDQVLLKSNFRHDHEPGAEIHSCEFKSNMLFRSIRFPHPIDLRTLKSELTSGVLRITARREDLAEPAKQPRPARKTPTPVKARKAKTLK